MCVFVGWVNNLVGGEKEAAKGFGFFMVSVDLTEDGIGELFAACTVCVLLFTFYFNELCYKFEA